MNRRAGGLVLLLVVLLAAAVVPNLAAKVVAGTPVAAPVPGPPAVGSCVTSVPPVSLFHDSGTKYLLLPPVQYGTCAADHYGEITAVLQHLPLQVNPNGSGNAAAGDPSDVNQAGYELLHRCPSAGLEYVGLSDPAAGNATDPADWVPVLNASFDFAGPDARQKAVGQNWGACVLVANSGIGDAAVSFPGPLRNAVTSGPVPAMFGYCSSDLSISTLPLFCSDPHTAQILGSAYLTNSLSSATARLQACRTIALRVTRMPDPTAGGRLLLEVFIDRIKADGTTDVSTGPPRKDESIYATCGIRTTGGVPLHDSLVGLGTAPLPLG